jgi:hypothetical protein
MSNYVSKRIRNAIMTEFGPLTEAIDFAVEQSFRTADLECRGSAGEADKVLSFFIDGLELIEHEFNRRLNSRRVFVSISAIFTHQTPMVELTTVQRGRRCELADLVMLATYERPNGLRGRGNGLFLQAKNNFDHDSSPVQRTLYEQETQFRYYRPASLAGLPSRDRSLPPKAEPALAYWELESTERYWAPYHPPVREGTGLLWANQVNRKYPRRHPFGAAIVDFLRGAAGYGFKEPKPGETGWSRIVWDLLTVTAQSAVNRQNINVKGAARGRGALVRYCLTHQPSQSQSYAMRNSLAETLSFYSQELGDLGTKLERQSQDWVERKQAHISDDFGGVGEPPILGNDRPSAPDGDGGAGNLVLFHFTWV